MPPPLPPKLLDLVRHHWGYETLRPLQAEAMAAMLDRRDSLVVLPTGAGKSLCFQAPALAQDGVTVVASPLIALMKDQVDSLERVGVAARRIDSSLTDEERFVCELDVREGRCKLLFVSPERLVGGGVDNLLRTANVTTLAIDEAHCISHWGHDFRPEYRQLANLRDRFPNLAIHAFTATATEQVRRDIVRQLDLQSPTVLVGDFDRPNLTYRVWPRQNLERQVADVIDRHKGEAGVVYCLRRRDVDDLAGHLQGRGYSVVAYHAGMSADERRRAQEEFIDERVDVVVATVAFGMGIDRSNVRFVIHAAMPKTLEHYQQETGRAGRDGLEAECVLLYSGGDAATLRSMLEKGGPDGPGDPEVVQAAIRQLDAMSRYCRSATCRHRQLVEHFGQQYAKPTCGACDHCLGDTRGVDGALVIAQKILSCVARVDQRYGIVHVISVLRGEQTAAVRERGHDKLTTYGLLREHSKADLRDWIDQLIGQGVLVQAHTPYPILQLNKASRAVMKGEQAVRLVQLVTKARKDRPRASVSAAEAWEGVDAEVFEKLRGVRRTLAEELRVPPYIIFSDAVLREFARRRPRSLEAMRQISGVGDVKLANYGERFLEALG